MSTVTYQTTTLATPPSGTTVDLQSGATGAGTQRVILATDQQAVPVKLQDGAGNALTSAARGSERAASVQIVDASGAQVTSFGGSGGTASNVGSAVPTPATAAGFSDATNLQLARVYDTDSGAGTQYTIGVSLRKTASGGSVEAGTSSDPLRTDPTGSTTQPVSGTVAATQSGAWSLSANQSVNNAQINGVAPSMGNGVSGTGVQRVTLASDSTGQVAIAGTVTVASHAVTNAGTFAVQNNAATPTGTNSIGTVALDNNGVGYTIAFAVSAATTNATSSKASAGRVHGWSVFNSNAAARYFKLYNKASAPTVGTDTPVHVVMIPAAGGANLDIPRGLPFSTGIAWALTTGAANSDTGAVALSEIIVNLYYI